MTLARRSFLTGLVSLIAAPAIAKVQNIMPVKMMQRVRYRSLSPTVGWESGPWRKVNGAVQCIYMPDHIGDATEIYEKIDSVVNYQSLEDLGAHLKPHWFDDPPYPKDWKEQDAVPSILKPFRQFLGLSVSDMDQMLEGHHVEIIKIRATDIVDKEKENKASLRAQDLLGGGYR